MHNPTDKYWEVVERIIGYLQGTKSFGLHLGSLTTCQLSVYLDAHWQGWTFQPNRN